MVLAAVAGLGSCGGDPTGDQIHEGERIVADPTSVFVGEGQSEFIVELVDALGNQMAADFQVQNAGSGITVEKDTTFLQTTIGTHLETSSRFVVSGQSPVATTFEVVSGDKTLIVPVKVVPASFAATFSVPAPAQNEPLTITAAPGYKFHPDANVEFLGTPSVVTFFSPDSTFFTFVPAPAPSATLTNGVVTGVEPPNIPGVGLDVPTVDSITVPLLDTLAGAEAPASAPTIPTPPVGQTSGFFDAGGFTGADVSGDGGLGAQYYHFTVAEAGTYTFSVGWEGGADIDLVLCPDATCSNPANNDFVAAGASNPEAADYDLVPGTYTAAVVLFDGAAPSRVDMTLTRTE
jgi:hypothetical protein